MGRAYRGRVVAAMLAAGLVLGATAPGVAASTGDEQAQAREAEREARRAEREQARAEREAELEAEREKEREEREKERERRREARAALDQARGALSSAESSLSAARAATRGARGAGGAAEGQRRTAEDELAPVIVEHREAQDRLAEARLRLRVLREDLADAEVDLEIAREQFEDRVVQAYKQGSVAARTTLAITLFREASSPGELAVALKDLEVVAGFGALRIDEIIDEIAHLEAQIVSARAEREDARLAVEQTAGAIDEQEVTTAARRTAAAVAEASLLAAISRELDLEREVRRARAGVDRARETYDRVMAGDEDADPAPPGPESGDEAKEASGSDQRRDWLAGRQRALARQQSVPAEARRAADDWICPVEGSRFVNDWGFPRSQDRRHEGTDVFAPEGTPIVAAVAAEVVAVNHVDRFNGRSGFGGLTVSYEADGERFYNAHLQRVAPGLEVGDEVAAGEVIGWVGRTGNARGTPPHLHLGVYVDDAAINPYPSLAVACAEDGRATGDDEEAEAYAELEQRAAEREERRREREEQRERQERERRGQREERAAARDDD